MDLTKRIGIGKVIPNIGKHKIMFYTNEEVEIDREKGKVIILDFFDTYCSSCIASLPKLQNLQDKMGDRLQLFLVTWQDKQTIEKFWSTNKFVQENDIKLPVIYSDTLLRQYFPHRGIPHTVWLYNNMVQAITFSDFISEVNIQDLYDKGRIILPVKSEFNEEPYGTAPPLISRLKGKVELSQYRDATESRGLFIVFDSTELGWKSSIHNIDILGAYTSTWSKIKKPTFLLKDERIIWKVKDKSIYKIPEGSGITNLWLLDNGICYERFDLIEREEKELAKIVLQDLNHFLGLNVYWSVEEIPCLVLQHTQKNKNKSKNKIVNNGAEGSNVLAFMIDYQGDYPPVIDEANSQEAIEVTDFSSIESINMQLEKYGLILKEVFRKTDVLIFEEV